MMRTGARLLFHTRTASLLILVVSVTCLYRAAIHAEPPKSGEGKDAPVFPRIVAAGTATFKLGSEQDNATFVHVQTADEIAARLGEDYIVLLTARYPSRGYPFFVPYWKKAKDGFDVTLVDVTLGPGSTASYATAAKAYPVDWVVVKK